jgi:hypothetical protein
MHEDLELKASMGQISKTLSQKQKYKLKGWGVAQVVKSLLSMREALSSIHNTARRKKKVVHSGFSKA